MSAADHHAAGGHAHLSAQQHAVESQVMHQRWRWVLVAVLALGGSVAAWCWGASPVQQGAGVVASLVLALWLAEVVPPFVPTLLLAALVPCVVGGLAGGGQAYGLRSVMGWMADPVLALFFGGFVLGAAASRAGLDRSLAAAALRASGGSPARLVAMVMLATAWCSMWMSNIAAAALMLAALRPALSSVPPGHALRPALLLALCMGANVGGMATPIGSGPNGIAIGVLGERGLALGFAGWMAIGVPLGAVALAALWVGICWRYGLLGSQQALLATGVADICGPALKPQRGLLVVGAAMIAAWLSEPLHGVSAAEVALLGAAVLFIGGWVDVRHLVELDWSTLLLVAGGLGLGELLATSGLVQAITSGIAFDGLAVFPRDLVIVLVAAVLSGLMSNTATAVMLIPLAAAFDPSPHMAVLIALGCSLGAPLVISTPANAMAVGARQGLGGRDLLLVGGGLMLVGSVALAALSPVLAWVLGAVLRN